MKSLFQKIGCFHREAIADPNSGFSIVESMVALSIVSGALMAGTMQFKMARKPLKDLENLSTVARIERDLITTFTNTDSLTHSIKLARHGFLERCYKGKNSSGKKSCKKGDRYPISVYIVNTRERVSGTKHFPLNFDQNGIPCLKKGRVDADPTCRVFNVKSWVRPVCPSTHGGNKISNSSCKRPTHSVLEYEIRVAGRKKPVARGFVDQPATFKQTYDPSELNLSCRDTEIVVGIGLNKTALCQPISTIEYADVPEGFDKSHLRVRIKPGECVPPHLKNPNSNQKPTHFSYVRRVDLTTGEVQCGTAEIPK